MTLTARSVRLALALVAALAAAACNSTDAVPPPDAPAPLAAVPNSDRQVTVTWGLSGEVATEIKIERAEASGVFAPLVTLPGITNTHVDVGLTPATAYQYRVQACNASGCSAFAGPVGVSTFATLRITTTSLSGVVVGDSLALPNAVRGQSYSAGITATGADSVYTWFVDAGSLPAGLAMTNLGIISGTPTTEQLARFTARVRSGDGQTAVREFTITVVAPVSGPALAIRTSLLPPALVNQTYQPALATTGGNGSAVSWSVVAGSLPPGVTLGTGGVFSGRPTATGTFTFTVRAANTAGQSDQKSLSVTVVADDIGRFNITRVDVSGVPTNIAPHVAAAISRWENAIRGDLAREDIPRGFFSSTGCGGFGEISNGTVVDDVIIMVNIAPIDGAGKILGQASPCAIRDDILTIVGFLTLDSDDLSRLAGTQTLTDIIFHEIGHILGIGTLWEGFDCPPQQGFSACWSYLVGAGAADPRFTGPLAVQEWQALGGVGTVPVENEGGSGTRDSHWRESIFTTEIMTGFVSPVGTPNPLSRMTLASLADMGYSVNYGAADSFRLGAVAALRSGPDEPWEQLDLGPILMKLPDGSKRTIPR